MKKSKVSLLLLSLFLLIVPFQFSYSDDNNSESKFNIEDLYGEVFFCTTDIHSFTFKDRIHNYKDKNDKFKLKLINNNEIKIKGFNMLVSRLTSDSLIIQSNPFVPTFEYDLEFKSETLKGNSFNEFFTRNEFLIEEEEYQYLKSVEVFVFDPFGENPSKKFTYTSNTWYIDGYLGEVKIGRCEVF